MATLGLTEAEREAIERFEREVIQPSMTALVILDFWSDGAGRASSSRRCSKRSPPNMPTRASTWPRSTSTRTSDRRAVPHPVDPDGLCDLPGQPVADLTNYRTEGAAEARARPAAGAAQDRRPQGPRPQAEIEPLMAMAEQVLADGDAPRAVSIFRQIRDMAPDNPAVIGGLVRALVAAGEIGRGARDPRRAAARAREEAGDQPGQGRARARRRRPRRTPPRSKPRLAANPDDHEARFELAAREWRGRRPRRAPPTRCSRSSAATASGTRARPARASSSCSRRRAWAIRGRAPSGAGCRPCCSHEPQAPRSRSSRWPGRSCSRARSCRCTFSSRAIARWSATRSTGAGRIGMIQPLRCRRRQSAAVRGRLRRRHRRRRGARGWPLQHRPARDRTASA